jgi:hypothetical protein
VKHRPKRYSAPTTLPIGRPLPQPGDRTSTQDLPPPYLLRFPIGKEHTIVVTSNKEMTASAWAVLERLIALQRDIWTADAAQGMPLEEPRREGGSGASAPASPVGNADAPETPSQRTHP